MKKAVVTGGASGIGEAIARRFVKEGYEVIILDMDKERGEKVAKELGVHFFQANVADYDGIKELWQNSLLQGVDILINNAGITRDNLFIRMTQEEWNLVINVNLKGTFNCTKMVVRDMMKKRWGRIINMASVIGIMGNAGQANYAASKAGVIAFTKSLAKELGSRNITVNAVAPGFIETPMTAKLSREIIEEYKKLIPLKRTGTPEDVANVVYFLTTEDASYITGQVIQVDGGMLM